MHVTARGRVLASSNERLTLGLWGGAPSGPAHARCGSGPRGQRSVGWFRHARQHHVNQLSNDLLAVRLDVLSGEPDLFLRLASAGVERLHRLSRQTLVVQGVDHDDRSGRDLWHPQLRSEPRPGGQDVGHGRNDRPWCPVGYGALEAVLEKCIWLPRAVNQPESRDSLVQHSRNRREERPEAHADELDTRGIHVLT